MCVQTGVSGVKRVWYLPYTKTAVHPRGLLSCAHGSRDSIDFLHAEAGQLYARNQPLAAASVPEDTDMVAVLWATSEPPPQRHVVYTEERRGRGPGSRVGLGQRSTKRET